MLEATCHLWCLTMLRWECVLDMGTSVPVCITLRRRVKKLVCVAVLHRSWVSALKGHCCTGKRVVLMDKDET